MILKRNSCTSTRKTRSILNSLVFALVLLAFFDVAIAAPQRIDSISALGSLAKRSSSSHQERYIKAQSVKKNLSALKGAQAFCRDFLHGEMPSQPYTTLKTSTSTKVTTPLATVTSTSLTETSVTSTSLTTTTPITTVVTSYQSTSIVDATTTTTTTTTSTNTLPPAKKRDLIHRREMLIRSSAAFNKAFASIQSLTHEIIEDACLLYLYHTLQYPTKTVTPSPITSTSTAGTLTTTTVTASTKTDSFYVTKVSTAPVSVLSSTITETPTTVTTTVSTVTITSSISTSQPYYQSFTYTIDFNEGRFNVDYSTDDGNGGHPAFVDQSSTQLIKFRYPQGGDGNSGYIYAPSSRYDNNYQGAVLGSVSDGQLIADYAIPTTSQFRLYCTFGENNHLSCQADNNPSYNTFYQCSGSTLHLFTSIPPSSDCTALTYAR